MRSRRRLFARLVVWPSIVLLAALTGAYFYATSPARIRALIEKKLVGAPADIRIGAVAFIFPDELWIDDLEIHPHVDSAAELSGSCITARSVKVHAPLTEWISGSPNPESIDVQGFVLRLGEGAESSSSSTLSSDMRDLVEADLESAFRSIASPAIRIDNAEIELMADSQRGRTATHWRFSARGGVRPEGYSFLVFGSDPRDPPALTVTLDRATEAIVVQAASMDIQEVAAPLAKLLPGPLGASLLNGALQLERLRVPIRALTRGDTSGVNAELTLRDWTAAIPIEDPPVDSSKPPAHFLRIADADVHLAVQGGSSDSSSVELRGRGRINGSEARLTFRGTPEAVQEVVDAIRAGDSIDATRLVGLGELTVRDFDLPTFERDGAFLNSSRLPGALRDAFHRYQPRGCVDVAIRIMPPTAETTAENFAQTRLEVDVDAKGGKMRYEKFPYEFHDVRGLVRVAKGHIRLIHMNGRHGTATIIANGFLDSWEEWTGFRLDIRARNVALTDDLFAALDDEDRSLWRECAPTGMCDLDLDMGRPSGTSELDIPKADIRLSTRLAGGAVSLEEHRLVNAQGMLTIHKGVIEVDDLRGFDGASAMRVSGRVSTRVPKRADLRVEVLGYPVEQAGPSIAATEAGESTGVRFRGTVDVWGRVSRELGEDGPKAAATPSHYSARIRNGQLVGSDSTQVWKALDGWVSVVGPQLDIRGFYAQNAGAMLAVGGDPDASIATQPSKLTVVTISPTVSETLAQLAPAEWRELLNSLGLSGKGELRVEVDNPGDGDTSTTLSLEAEQCRIEKFPLPLTSLSGRVRMEGDTLTISDARAELGGGIVTLNGTRTKTGTTSRTEATAKADNVQLNDEITNALPEDLADIVRRLEIRGAMSAKLNWSADSGDSFSSYSVTGAMALRDARIALGLDLEEFDGVIQAKYTDDGAGHSAFEGTFKVARGKLAGRVLDNVSGTLKYPVERKRVAATVQGAVGEGQIQATVLIDPKTREYELREVRLVNVPLARLMPPRKDDKSLPRPGLLSGSFSLGGRAGDSASRKGNGFVSIVNAGFLDEEIRKDVERVRRTQLSERVDEEATIRFTVGGSQILLNSVELRGADVRLVGENGRINLTTDQIDLLLTLMLGNEERPPRDAMIRYQLRGPWEKPTREAVPLIRDPFEYENDRK